MSARIPSEPSRRSSYERRIVQNCYTRPATQTRPARKGGPAQGHASVAPRPAVHRHQSCVHQGCANPPIMSPAPRWRSIRGCSRVPCYLEKSSWSRIIRSMARSWSGWRSGISNGSSSSPRRRPPPPEGSLSKVRRLFLLLLEKLWRNAGAGSGELTKPGRRRT